MPAVSVPVEMNDPLTATQHYQVKNMMKCLSNPLIPAGVCRARQFNRKFLLPIKVSGFANIENFENFENIENNDAFIYAIIIILLLFTIFIYLNKK